MNKKEYLKKLDSLNLDKNKYCIIAGGIFLLYGLKDSTEDIDIKTSPEYFNELQKRFEFKKSSKYPYLYEMSGDIEVAVLEYDKTQVKFVNGYPVESLQFQLDWMIKENREKDKEKIKIIKKYLQENNL